MAYNTAAIDEAEEVNTQVLLTTLRLFTLHAISCKQTRVCGLFTYQSGCFMNVISVLKHQSVASCFIEKNYDLQQERALILHWLID